MITMYRDRVLYRGNKGGFRWVFVELHAPLDTPLESPYMGWPAIWGSFFRTKHWLMHLPLKCVQTMSSAELLARVANQGLLTLYATQPLLYKTMIDWLWMNFESPSTVSSTVCFCVGVFLRIVSCPLLGAPLIRIPLAQCAGSVWAAVLMRSGLHNSFFFLFLCPHLLVHGDVAGMPHQHLWVPCLFSSVHCGAGQHSRPHVFSHAILNCMFV